MSGGGERASDQEGPFAVWEAGAERWWLEAGTEAPVEGDPRAIAGAFELAEGVWVVPVVREAKPVSLPLTPRQLEVARLAAAGKTHKEIAAALGMRAETARTHLKNIYRRLDVASRVDLADVVARGEP